MTLLLRLAAVFAILLALRWLWLWFWRSGWRRLVEYSVKHAQSRSPLPPRHGTVKRDPVCGTHVDISVAVREEVNGATHFFCSEDCRQTYLAGSRPAGRKVGIR